MATEKQTESIKNNIETGYMKPDSYNTNPPPAELLTEGQGDE